MSLVDDRGRLFGRVNLVDAAVIVFIGMLVPLAYASYLLFRSPPATLTGVEPSSMVLGRNPRVRVTGENLRPFMRVSFNDEQGRTFLIGSTTSAEVDLPPLQPGVYDVVLYDYAQELDRLPKALTIEPPTPAPTTELVVTGRFIGLTEAQVEALEPGVHLASVGPDSAELLAAGEPAPASARIRSGGTSVTVALGGQYQLPAAVRLKCSFESNADGSLRCQTSVGSQPTPIAPDAVLGLQRNDSSDERFNFQVSDVYPASRPDYAMVRIRPVGARPMIDHVTPGDVDFHGPAFPDAWIGSVAAVGPGSEITLRLPVQRIDGVWQYRTFPLKIGRGLRFETSSYVVDGTILGVQEPGPNR